MFGNDVRDAARHNGSRNKLKEHGVGIHGYKDVFKKIPPGFTTAYYGRALHSWQTLILPYVEETNLFKRIDLAQPWNSSRNTMYCRENVDLFINPSV